MPSMRLTLEPSFAGAVILVKRAIETSRGILEES